MKAISCAGAAQSARGKRVAVNTRAACGLAEVPPPARPAPTGAARASWQLAWIRPRNERAAAAASRSAPRHLFLPLPPRTHDFHPQYCCVVDIWPTIGAATIIGCMAARGWRERTGGGVVRAARVLPARGRRADGTCQPGSGCQPGSETDQARALAQAFLRAPAASSPPGCDLAVAHTQAYQRSTASARWRLLPAPRS